MADVEIRIYKAGQIIFRERETGDQAFVVKSGVVEITKHDESGKEIHIGTVCKGGMFGEMALIDNKLRMASARAKDEGTEVMVVTKELFDNKINKADPFVRGMLNILVDYVRKTSG